MEKPLVLCLSQFWDVVHLWGKWEEDQAQCMCVSFWQGGHQLPWETPSSAVGTTACWVLWRPSHNPRCFGGTVLIL